MHSFYQFLVLALIDIAILFIGWFAAFKTQAVLDYYAKHDPSGRYEKLRKDKVNYSSTKISGL
jgi:hypothetical protein